MSGIGLAIITSAFTPSLCQTLRPCLKLISEECSSLYLHFTPHPHVRLGRVDGDERIVEPPLAPGFRFNTLPVNEFTKKVIFDIYGGATRDFPQLDLRIVISNFTNSSYWQPPTHQIRKRLTHLYSDSLEQDAIRHYVEGYFSLFHSFENEIVPTTLEITPGETDTAGRVTKKCYDHVVLGGTFDRLHVGHKWLLTESSLIAEKSITVGVTDGAMNKKKKLFELIERTPFRVEAVTNFILEIKPSVEPKIVSIQDPFGPSIVDPKLEAIIVSQETIKGGNAVNAKRREKDLSVLDVIVIPLLEDNHLNTLTSAIEEEKISSSSERVRTLGMLLKNSATDGVGKTFDPAKRPFIIGLTGGIASGKTSVSKRLEKLGAARIDCDQLGHQAYAKGSSCFEKVVSAFGNNILCESTGEIDRKKLGPIVFSDPGKLSELNGIVWPAIRAMVLEITREAHESGKEIVVIEAAILLEAEWDDMVDEVWLCVIPEDEAIKRIVQRNGLTPEAAQNRVRSQASNEDRIHKAHVVLSTLWEPEFTQQQCEKAWNRLTKGLNLQ